MVGRGGRKARRLSLTRTPALFPLFRLFLSSRSCGPHKGFYAVSVNKAPAFKNLKSGLHCVTEEPMFKIVNSYTNTSNMSCFLGACNPAAILGAILVFQGLEWVVCADLRREDRYSLDKKLKCLLQYSHPEMKNGWVR